MSFSVRQAPYLLSYATYVAATIHVRLASSSSLGSNAHESLAVCLTVLDLNSKTNPAVRKASVVIEALMKAMNVNMERPQENSSARATQRDAVVQQSAGALTDQTARSAAQQSYVRGTPYNNQQNLMPPMMMPANVEDGNYQVEPGAEYFGDFAFDGMDDILFGFNASESIFQDFM